ncbi:MAG: hypothetical protein DHS20C08_22600 [Rhodomicrobium sp.]|nr:MAG: hypothetical protein DHS20C08_22600 [Rhodomicrobium sp.]
MRCTSCSHTWHADNDSLLDDLDQLNALEAAVEEEIPPLSPTDEIFEELDITDNDELAEENGQDDIDSLFDELDLTDEEGAGGGALDELFDPPMEAAAEETPDMEFDAEPEVSEENSQDDIDGLFDEPVVDGGKENGQDDIDSLFDEPEISGAEEDDGEPNSQDDIDGLFDDDPAPPLDEVAAAEEEPSGVQGEAPTAQTDEPSEELDDPFDNPSIEAEKEDVAADEPDPQALPIWKRMDKKVAAGWAGYASAVLLFTVVMVFARDSVVRVAPAMASLYNAIGLPVNVRGIVFTNVQQRWRTVGDRIILQVEGEISNQTNSYKQLPPIIIGGLSEDRREVFRWVAKVRDKPLLPGEKAPFITDIPAPPATAKHLLLRFED